MKKRIVNLILTMLLVACALPFAASAAQTQCKEHSLALTSYKEYATCTKQGIGVYECRNCDYTEDKTLPMLPHTEKNVSKKAATCTEAGHEKGVECSVCKKVISGMATIPAAHKYDTTDASTIVETVLEPTCTARGIVRYKCTECDATKKVNVDALGHKSVTIKATSATCTKPAMTAGTKCSRCDEVLEAPQKNGKALGHDYAANSKCQRTGCGYECKHEGKLLVETEEGRPANCTDAEYFPAVKCTECNYTAAGYYHGAGLGHTWENGVCTVCEVECVHDYEETSSAKAATCDTGYLTAAKKCKICKIEVAPEEVTDALGHSYNMGYVTTEATCTEDGVKTYTCIRKINGKNCGHTYTEVVPATGHKYSVDTCSVCLQNCDHEGTLVETEEGRPATCYDAEYFPAVECTECNYTAAGYYHGAGLGHTWENGVCTACKAECVHDYEETSSAKAATCDTGYLTAAKKCKICKFEVAPEEITDALGHDYNAGYITTQPTCLEDGVKTYTCKRDNCDHTYTEPVAARGHHVYSTASADLMDTCIYCLHVCDHEDTLVETEKGRPANCYDAEYFPAVKCTECNYTKAGYYYGTGLGHDLKLGDFVSTKPTCLDKGWGRYECQREGCEYTEGGWVPATGHHYEVVQEWKPTCTVKGCTKSICKGCNLVRYEDTAPLGHSMQPKDGLEATCSVDGYTAYEQCERCGLIEGKEAIAAGHEIVGYQCQKCGLYLCDHDGEIEIVESTCTVHGTETFSCAICGYEHTKELPLAEHDYENRCKAATCTEKGMDLHVCKNCGDEIGEGEIDMIAHNYVRGQCTECGAKESGRPGNTTPTRPGTSEPDGRPNGTPDDSENNGSMSGTTTPDTTPDDSETNGRPSGVAPACGHTHTDTVTQENTCTRNGSVIKYCTDCNTVVETTVKTAPGHNFVMGACAVCGEHDPAVYTNDFNNYYIVGGSTK